MGMPRVSTGPLDTNPILRGGELAPGRAMLPTGSKASSNAVLRYRLEDHDGTHG
jgi:hypothetical protein